MCPLLIPKVRDDSLAHGVLHMGDRMRRGRMRWLAGLMIVLQIVVWIPTAHAFVPILFGAGRIGAFIGAALPYGMRSVGIAARSPRMLSTVQSVGRGLASSLRKTGRSLAGLPWAKTAAYAGIAAVGTPGATYLLVDGLNWAFHDDPETVTVSRSAEFGPTPPQLHTSSLQRDFLMSNPPGVYWGSFAADSTDIKRVTLMRVECQKATGTCIANVPFNETRIDASMSGAATSNEDHWLRVQSLSYTADVEDRHLKQMWIYADKSGTAPTVPSVQEVLPLNQALDELLALPDEKLSEPLSDAMLAGLANSVHAAATAELPHDEENFYPWAPSQPLVRPADVEKIFAENPTLARPVLRDLAEAIAPPSAIEVPLPVPEQYQPINTTPTPEVPPITPPGGNVSVDFGPDPGVGAPDLESIPTAQMIIEPLMGLFPDLRGADFGMAAGECPKVNFELFGRDHVMESHCWLLENNRAAIGLVSTLMWSILGLAIVLRA